MSNLALKRQESYTVAKGFEVYVYHLSTGLTIRSNGQFTFNDSGNTTISHCGEINGKFCEYINFNSSAIIAQWIE